MTPVPQTPPSPRPDLARLNRIADRAEQALEAASDAITVPGRDRTYFIQPEVVARISEISRILPRPLPARKPLTPLKAPTSSRPTRNRPDSPHDSHRSHRSHTSYSPNASTESPTPE